MTTYRFFLAAAALAIAHRSPAQTAYDVFVEGVFPARVVVDAGGRGGQYRYGPAGGDTLRLAGGCQRGACTLVAIDSALALRFTHDSDSLTGWLRLGDGRERPLAGQRRYDLSAPLLTGCEEGAWLRGYGTADGEYALAIANLPGRSIRGTLFVRGLELSLPVYGTLDGQSLEMLIGGPGGGPAGSLAGTFTGEQLRAAISLELDGTPGPRSTVALSLSDDLALACVQSAGTRDLSYPVTGDARADLDLQRRVRLWWRALAADAPDAPHRDAEPPGPATGWFEPTRLDDAYLSGWQHLELPGGRTESHAVTVDRERGRLLRGSTALTGSRRERDARRTAARRRAIAAHPLADDEGFRAWADSQVLAEFAVAREGLTFGGEHHPVYGQLRWTEPWESLEAERGLVDLLPDWLRGWIGGVPAERE